MIAQLAGSGTLAAKVPLPGTNSENPAKPPGGVATGQRLMANWPGLIVTFGSEAIETVSVMVSPDTVTPGAPTVATATSLNTTPLNPSFANAAVALAGSVSIP